jgi:branched-chain amino acid aminotransferase
MSEDRPKYAILNGELVPFGEARVSVMAPGMTFASLVFEGLRGYWNADERQLYVFRMAEHLERMQFGMALLEFDAPPGTDDFARQIHEVIRANELREDCYIRPQAYVDDWGDMKATGPVGSSVVCRRRPRAAAFEAGMHFMVSSWRRNSDEASPPRIKSSANYLNNRLVGLEAKRAGFDGAVILNPNGTVSEGPGGCLFLLRHGRLATPTVNAGILESITRATLLELAGAIGIEAEERDFTRTELYLADELFYCGTGQEMIPVLSVDRKRIGDGAPGPVTRRLQAAYDDVLRGRDDRYRHWLTAIYD